MGYFNYHATAHRLIAEGKLIDFYITKQHNHIAPALVLLFDDSQHPIMPIRKEKWPEYWALLFERQQ